MPFLNPIIYSRIRLRLPRLTWLLMLKRTMPHSLNSFTINLRKLSNLAEFFRAFCVQKFFIVYTFATSHPGKMHSAIDGPGGKAIQKQKKPIWSNNNGFAIMKTNLYTSCTSNSAQTSTRSIKEHFCLRVLHLFFKILVATERM